MEGNQQNWTTKWVVSPGSLHYGKTSQLARSYKCRVLVDCKSLKFAAAGWHTGKYLNLNPTIKHFVVIEVIWLRVIGWKETGLVCFLNLFREGGEGVAWFIVCGVLLDYWANGLELDIDGSELVLLQNTVYIIMHFCFKKFLYWHQYIFLIVSI